jgi:hypothetical protein
LNSTFNNKLPTKYNVACGKNEDPLFKNEEYYSPLGILIK